MDDLSSKISELLSNPESINQIKAMAAGLGLGDPVHSDQSTGSGGQGSGPDISSIAAMLSGLTQDHSDPPPPQAVPNVLDNLDMGVLLKIGQALSSINTKDKNVELLLALKPHFKGDRAKKVDDAVRLMQLVQLLPMLKESGLFGSDLFGGLFGGKSND